MYWANSDAIAATLGDGWVHNGDAGYVDANPPVIRPIEITRAVQLVRRYHMVDEAPRFAPISVGCGRWLPMPTLRP